MYICNYCNRVLKHEYEKCPGCGGSSFKTKAFLGETIIKEPPKDGYKVNIKNYKKSIKIANFTILFRIFVSLFALFFMNIFFKSNFPEDGLFKLAISLIFFLPFFLVGMHFFTKGLKKRKKFKRLMTKTIKLSKKGILVKAMPYKMIYTSKNFEFNERIEVKFKNSNGVEIPLYSEPKHYKKKDSYDTADLLIDPNDYSNYFVDFEIY